MFEIYKKGQGIAARWMTAAALGALAVFGCFALQGKVGEYTNRVYDLGSVKVPLSLMVSAAVFAAAAILIAAIINHKRFVDYLISSEVELRKVSWPTKAELKQQTIVVIATIIFFAIVLRLSDIIFAFGSRRLYGF